MPPAVRGNDRHEIVATGLAVHDDILFVTTCGIV